MGINQYQPKREHYDYNMFANQRAYPPPPIKTKPQYGGAARLFHYLEVSDTSEPEDEAQQAAAGPFLGDEEEPPPFVCQECGCEFVDDTSLETHNFTHHNVKPNTGNIEEKKISNNTQLYECSVCKTCLSSQASIMEHMRTHSQLSEHSNSFARYGNGMLPDHELMMHKMANNIVRCPHCCFTFELGPELDHHLRQHHEANVLCMTCEASLDRALRMRTSRTCFDESRMMNQSPSPSQSSRDDFKRSRKQRQPRKVVSEMSDSEIQVLRYSGFGKRRNAMKKSAYSVEMSQLVDKYTRFLLARKRLKCSWCRQEMNALPYHTPVSLALHRLWRHTKTKFQCEHCDKRYKHQYQVVLHSSRDHVTINRAASGSKVFAHSIPSDITTTVPESIKEPIILLDSSVPVKLPPPTFQTINCLSVPDVSTLHTNYSTGLNLPKHFPLIESYPKHHHITMQQPHIPPHSPSSLHQQITLLVPTLPMP